MQSKEEGWEDWEDWEDWGESGDWESSLTALIWIAVITMWILVFLRLFLSIVMCKFYKEGNDLKANAIMDTTDSHPCRQKK